MRAGLQAGPCIRPLLAPPGLDTPRSGPRCQHSRARSQDSCLRKLLTLLFLGLHAVKRLAQAPGGVLLSPFLFRGIQGGSRQGKWLKGAGSVSSLLPQSSRLLGASQQSGLSCEKGGPSCGIEGTIRAVGGSEQGLLLLFLPITGKEAGPAC